MQAVWQGTLEATSRGRMTCWSKEQAPPQVLPAHLCVCARTAACGPRNMRHLPLTLVKCMDDHTMQLLHHQH
jgi:hypothetical protein